jgi:hypothetical protein
MAFISAKRRHTASGTLQNGSFGKGWVNWWKCWIARQSKEPCFACAEGPRRQTSVDAFEFAAECSFNAKLPTLPVGDAGKVRMGGYAPTLPVGDAGKVRMGGSLFLPRGGNRSGVERHES